MKAESFTFTVNPFDDTPTHLLTPATLGRRILACAELHAGVRGFARLEQDGCPLLWVLSRLVIEMERWPRLGETYTITTWVRRYYRYFCDRCFEITDGEGKVIGRAFTIWAMIDALTRRSHLLGDLVGKTMEPYCDAERQCNIRPLTKVKTPAGPLVDERVVYYSDIDENNHVNSIRYIDFALDTFPASYYTNNTPARIEMAYHNETAAGGHLCIHRAEQTDGSFHLSFTTPDGGAVCTCALAFTGTKQ